MTTQADELGAAEELGKALDELNRELDEAEATIASLGIGERAAVPFSDGSVFVFSKMNDNWRLGRDNGSGDVVRLTRCAKRWRIEAASLLPTLLEALRAAEVTRLDEVRSAIGLVRKFRGAEA